MKANELRIGNYINTPFGGVSKCEGVLCDGIHTHNYEDINYGFVQPIPLTEEWLVKFGFEKLGDFSNNAIRLDVYNYLCLDNGNDGSEYSAVSIYDEDDYVFIYLHDIEHVHQLQNLYFALTGEELKLKDDENN